MELLSILRGVGGNTSTHPASTVGTCSSQATLPRHVSGRATGTPYVGAPEDPRLFQGFRPRIIVGVHNKHNRPWPGCRYFPDDLFIYVFFNVGQYSFRPTDSQTSQYGLLRNFNTTPRKGRSKRNKKVI